MSDPTITLSVPNEDFDGMELLMGLKWLRNLRATGIFDDYEDKSRHADKILTCIARKYAALSPELTECFKDVI